MSTKIHINTAADTARSAIVRSELDPTPAIVPDAVKGNINDYKFGLVDGIGDFDTTTSADVASLKVAVGPIGGPPLVQQEGTFWSYDSPWLKGFLDYSGVTLAAAIGAADSLDTYMEVEMTSIATSHAHTLLQAPMKVLNRINT